MTDATQDQLIHDIAHDVVDKIAHDELRLFPVISKAYFEHQQKVLANKKAEDVLLGFGPENVPALFTPIVLTITTEVIKKVLDIFWPPKPKNSQAHLSPEQLLRIRQVAIEKARQLNLTEAQIQLLTDALLARLALPFTSDEA